MTKAGSTFREATARREADGTWIGWIEFHPLDGEGVFLRTSQETSQPNRAALAYWASGLEPIYFEGAFNRAGELTER